MTRFTNDSKSELLKHTNGFFLTDSWKFRHLSDSNFQGLGTFHPRFFGFNVEPQIDCIPDGLNRLVPVAALGMTTRQIQTGHGPTFMGFDKPYSVIHARNVKVSETASMGRLKGEKAKTLKR
jgi:hypothetical protein